MELEHDRIRSFSHCPRMRFSFTRLAAAGFYHENHHCKCFECGIIFTDSCCLIGDIFEVHKKLSPYCRFIQSKENIPRPINISSEVISLKKNVNNQREQHGNEETITVQRPGTHSTRHSVEPSYSPGIPLRLNEQSSAELNTLGGTVAYADDELTDIVVDLRSGSTRNISHPYLEKEKELKQKEEEVKHQYMEIGRHIENLGQETVKHDLEKLNLEMQIIALTNEKEKELKQKEEEVKQQYMEIDRHIENLDQEIVKRDVEKLNLEMQIIALKNEVEAFRSNNTQICELCCTEVRNVVFLPCGHVYCCEQCAMRLQSISPGNQNAECPLCKLSIENSVKFFWS